MDVDLFEGCWTRWERANEHRRAMAQVWNEYLSDHPFDFSLDDHGGGEFILQVHQDRPVPALFSVLCGEWLYNLRGCLVGSFVGLVPSEYSSGASRVQGSITKTGNTHARRLLIEAAWHHRARYRPGSTMLARWELASPAARARGDEGNRRLHARWARFDEHHKRPVIADIAIARELAGWCWSLAALEDDAVMAR